jgi:hypothetical protein
MVHAAERDLPEGEPVRGSKFSTKPRTCKTSPCHCFLERNLCLRPGQIPQCTGGNFLVSCR